MRILFALLSPSLNDTIGLEELQRTIKEIGTGKSAGPDALPAEFYESFEELVKRDFLRLRILHVKHRT